MTDTNRSATSQPGPDAVKIQVLYRSQLGMEEEQPFVLDPAQPLRITVNQVTQLFNCSGIPLVYGLYETVVSQSTPSKVPTNKLLTQVTQFTRSLETP